MLEHVDVLGACGPHRQRLRQACAVGGQRLGGEAGAGAGPEAAELGIDARAVGEDRELVRRVKRDEVARAWPRRGECVPAGGGEHALDEALAEAGVGQAAFLFHRQERQRIGEGGGEPATADAAR